MLWVKMLHIIAVVTWFAGLFYLPRLYVYHAMTGSAAVREQFKIMERKLFFGITTPGGIVAVGSGLWLWLSYGISGGWLQMKLVFVGILIGFHYLCGKYLFDFKHDRNRHGHKFYRWFNEVPTLLLFIIVALVVIKPF
ncbi:MAG TPA: protoporphyrinogen oxidase HemJ [Acidiferrobacteraceae bacterium]|nr:protoporphyrinogen oxidase HemJ [Acidiferrobacteraceae bacterium]